MIRPTRRATLRESVHLGANLEQLEPRAMMTAQPAGDFFLDYSINDQQLIEDQRHDDLSPLLTDAHALTGLDDARATYGFTGAGQTVAVIDSGIAYDHNALGGGFGSSYRVVGGWDFTGENDADPYDDDPSGSHGTHVAGIIGSDDATHQGVAPGVDLVALRVFDDSGAGYFSWVENALQWVHDNRNSFENPITAVNLSLGATWNSDSIPNWATLEDEFAQLEADGIFIAVAAGNSFTSYNTTGLSYPAVSPYVVAVASVDDDGALSYFSQRDVGVIAAPGRGVTSTVPDYVGNNNGQGDDFGTMSGTSMATPYVAGASVLLREALLFVGTTNITQDMIYQIMVDTADSVYDSATSASYNRLNVEAALDSIIPADEYGNDVVGAFGLGTLNNSQNTAGMLSTLDDADYFTFTAGQTGNVTLSSSLATSTGNVGVTLEHVGGATSTSGSLSFGVVAGQTYSVAISSPGELGTYSLAFGVAWSATPPTAPGSVTVTGSSATQIDLAWTDSDGETGYLVYQWTGSGSRMIASLAAGTTSHQVTGLSSGSHWFTIGAYNSAGSNFSPWTSGSTFVVPPTSIGTLSISTVSNTQLDLSWSDTTGETGYYVYRWNGSSSQFVTSLSAGTTSYRASGLAANETHWFTVGAHNSAGRNFTGWNSGSTLVTPPTAPGSFNVATVSSTELDLSWNDATGETGYYVYRWNGSSSQYVASLAAGTTSYRASGLASGQSHWFTVGAYNSAGSAFASWSSGTTLTAPPTAPGSLSISAVSSSELDLTWNDSTGETGYYVYRWNGSSSQYVASLSADTTSYRASGLAAEETHWFTVGAYNGSGASFASWTSGVTLAASGFAINSTSIETDRWIDFSAPIETTSSTQIESNTFTAAAAPRHDASRFASRPFDALDEAFAKGGTSSAGDALRSVDSFAASRQYRSTRHMRDEVFGETNVDFRRISRLDLARIIEVDIASAILRPDDEILR